MEWLVPTTAAALPKEFDMNAHPNTPAVPRGAYGHRNPDELA